MKHFLISAVIFLATPTLLHASKLDDALARILAGEDLSKDVRKEATTITGPASGTGVDNNGSRYLEQVQKSIVDPERHGGWPFRTSLVWESKIQHKTYNELKAIYEKDKSPVNAYALVCPAMYVDDFELLPELFKKIAENKPLKAHFDITYAKFWKPRLDPDF